MVKITSYINPAMSSTTSRNAGENYGRTLEELAAQSSGVLKAGYPFYKLDTDPLTVVGSYSREIRRVIGPIPSRGFRVSRSPEEYRRKLAMDPINFIHLTTASEGPHNVLELGSGIGR